MDTTMTAIRGAVLAERNERDAIVRATGRMLREIRERNDLREEDVLSAFFTMTPDLDAEFPAYAAREMGWTSTAMLGARETAVPGAMDRVIRVLIHARSDGPPRHVYLGEAAAMRPDLLEEGDAGPTPGEHDASAEAPAAEASRFGTLLVVGMGLIGGSAALALRRRGLFREVWGLDRDPEALERGLEAGALDRAVGAGSPGTRDGTAREDHALERADVVLLALPVDNLIRWLGRHGGRLSRGTVVMDVGSTKRDVVDAMESLPEGVQTVGSHPMAGSTETGMAASRPDLFHGADWALVETSSTGERARSVAETMVRAAGGRPFWTRACPHDRAVAATSHLPYLLAAALARHLESQDERLPVRRLLGPGARDMTRLACSDPEVMAGIVSTNRRALLEQIDAFRGQLERLIEEFDERGAERLEEVRRTGRRLREGKERWGRSTGPMRCAGESGGPDGETPIRDR